MSGEGISIPSNVSGAGGVVTGVITSNSTSSTPTTPPAQQQQFCLKWNNYSSNMVRTFGQMIMDQDFVDVTLACEGSAIKAHKVVLSACSDYFKELFLANPCKHPIVILKDMKMDDLKAIVDFMYKGEVNVFNHQLAALLKTAHILKVKGLTESKDDDEDDCHNNQENIQPNSNHGKCNVNANVINNNHSLITDLDKTSGRNIIVGGSNLTHVEDRLMTNVDRHNESSVNHILNSSQQSSIISQNPSTLPPLQPLSQQQFHQQTQPSHHQILPPPHTKTLPPPGLQSTSTISSSHHQETNHQLSSSASSTSSTSSQSHLLESFRSSQSQLQKSCHLNRGRRRRRSKRVGDVSAILERDESDSGSGMGSGDEEMSIKKDLHQVIGHEQSITTTAATATSTSALQQNASSTNAQVGHNVSQEPHHSFPSTRKKLSLPLLHNIQPSSNQDTMGNTILAHDDSNEPWHEEEQMGMNAIEGDDESNGMMTDIKPIVSFDEGESISNSLSVPTENVGVSQGEYDTHSPGSNDTPSQAYKYSKNCRCDVCDLTFTALSSLRRHQERHYPVRKRYECEVCQKSYSRKDYLKEHCKNKHPA